MDGWMNGENMPRLKNTHPHCLLSSGREIGGKLRPFFLQIIPQLLRPAMFIIIHIFKLAETLICKGASSCKECSLSGSRLC